ncbi:MAG: MATE family efflux transporter [Phycisphaeraceae bacterium]|nr:MATE family efflux transporter [Phycisphaeraceae bacterium]
MIVLAWWPFLEHLLHSLVGFVDTGLAGRLSVAATNAIAVSAYVGWLMGMLHMGVGIGTGALVARAVGGRHRGLANAALGQATVLALGWGAAVGAFVFLVAPPICRTFGLDGEALPMAVLYIRLITLAAPFSAMMFVGNAALRAAGDTRTPFLIMVAVNVVNTGLSILLVFGPAPWGGYGILGIAAGTMISWTIGGGIVLLVLLGGWGPLRLFVHRLRPHWHTIRRIVRVGIPNVGESLGMWVGNVLVAMIVGQFLVNKAALGAHIIAIRVESLSFLPGVALGTAAATLAGQYLGADDKLMARRAVARCWLYAAAGMTLMGVIFVIIPEPLARLLAPDEPALYKLAREPIQLAGLIQIFFATYIVLAHALRGAGDTRASLVITALTTFGVRLPAAWLLGVTLDMGLTGIWMALCGELVVRGVLFAIRFLRGRWVEVEV